MFIRHGLLVVVPALLIELAIRAWAAGPTPPAPPAPPSPPAAPQPPAPPPPPAPPASCDVRTDEQQLPPFHGISAGGDIILRVHRGERPMVRITADACTIARFEPEVDDGVLELGFDGDWSWRRARRPEIDVTTAALDQLDLSGVVRASVDRFGGDDLDIDSSGAVSIDAALDYKTVDLDVSGGGEVTLKGSADTLRLDVSGAPRIAAAGFAARTIEADLSGAARAELRASCELHLDASGACHVRYFGNPHLVQDTSGAVRIERAGD